MTDRPSITLATGSLCRQPPIAEIIGPSGRVHYRRPRGDELVTEAGRTPGYRVRFVWEETVEPPRNCSDD